MKSRFSLQQYLNSFLCNVEPTKQNILKARNKTVRVICICTNINILMVFLSKKEKKIKKRVRKQPGDEFGVLMIIGSEPSLWLKA